MDEPSTADDSDHGGDGQAPNRPGAQDDVVVVKWVVVDLGIDEAGGREGAVEVDVICIASVTEEDTRWAGGDSLKYHVGFADRTEIACAGCFRPVEHTISPTGSEHRAASPSDRTTSCEEGGGRESGTHTAGDGRI